MRTMTYVTDSPPTAKFLRAGMSPLFLERWGSHLPNFLSHISHVSKLSAHGSSTNYVILEPQPFDFISHPCVGELPWLHPMPCTQCAFKHINMIKHAWIKINTYIYKQYQLPHRVYCPTPSWSSPGQLEQAPTFRPGDQPATLLLVYKHISHVININT
jgi:hypothetical protein